MPGGDLSVRLGRPKDAGTTSPSTPNDHHTNEYRNMSNVSMQTGEEFSPEFLRDCVSRRTPFTDDANQTNRGPTGRGYVNTKKSENLVRSFSGKIKFLCSFGGSILPRPNDSKLRYVGGDTRIISIRKDISYNDLVEKTMGVCNYHHTIKYQIPGEDLDALISVSSDEDLHHMIEEYHELERKSQRLRIFLVSCCELEDQKQKGDVEYQYVVAVNGLGPQRSSSRESLESLTMQKEPSSVNLKCMISGPSYVAPAQLIDPNKEFVRTYENSAPRVDPMLAPDFRKPSNEFQPPSMYIPSEKLVPSQDMFCFPHASGLGAKDKGGFGLGKTAENTFFPFANEKYQKPSYKDQLFQEPPNVDRDYVEWGNNANRRKGKEISSEQDRKNGAINNDYAEFLEQKMYFPNIICQPNEPNFVMKSQKAESILNLPEDEYSLGLYSSVFLDTTTNDELGGDSDGNVKIGKMDKKLYEELSIENDVFTDSSSSEKHVTDEHSDEAGSVAYASEDDDDKGDDDNKNEPINSAAVIEMEASRHGFQIIKNSDLEELQELGSGTFGTVYHGKWRGTDVAIKRIKNSCFLGGASEQEKLTKDFWREAKILSKIHHPNIVAFYGVTPDGPGSTLATVSEYMVNGSLRRVLFKGRALDRRKKVIIALDASFGMEYLHLKNIVHFDLKCDNLLVNLVDSQRPVCKVTDFGLSRIKQNTLVSGGVRGTLPWMAPELLDGDSSRVSEKVDVFSFGIAMWEIFTGEEPYVDMHCGAIIGGIVNNTLRPLVPERCDPEWRKLMEECWSHDPAGRPSFSEITKRLQAMSTSLQPKRYTYRVKR